MKELDNDKQKYYNIKLNFYNEDIDLKINSDFNKLRKNICEIMKISSDQFDSLLLSYIDEDGDNIRLSTEDDYEIFFKQVIEKTVDKIKIVFNNNSVLDEDRCIKCLEDALNYQEEQSKVYVDDDDNKNKNNNNNNGKKDNQINENILLENKIEDNDNVLNEIKIQEININEYQINDNEKNNQNNKNIKNSNNNIIINDNYAGNNNYRKNENFDNLINNIEDPINDNNNNNNEDIENFVYQYSCSACALCPILFVMYYCPECVLYLCEDCKKNMGNHFHQFIKIESKKQLLEIKEKENDEIERKRKKEDEYNNNNNNNIINNPKQDINQENEKDKHKNFFEKCYNKAVKFYEGIKKKFIVEEDNGINLTEEMKYAKIAKKAKKTYDLKGIDNTQLIKALKQTNGNIDQAIIYLTK